MIAKFKVGQRVVIRSTGEPSGPLLKSFVGTTGVVGEPSAQASPIYHGAHPGQVLIIPDEPRKDGFARDPFFWDETLVDSVTADWVALCRSRGYVLVFRDMSFEEVTERIEKWRLGYSGAEVEVCKINAGFTEIPLR